MGGEEGAALRIKSVASTKARSSAGDGRPRLDGWRRGTELGKTESGTTEYAICKATFWGLRFWSIGSALKPPPLHRSPPFLPMHPLRSTPFARLYGYVLGPQAKPALSSASPLCCTYLRPFCSGLTRCRRGLSAPGTEEHSWNREAYVEHMCFPL